MEATAGPAPVAWRQTESIPSVRLILYEMKDAILSQRPGAFMREPFAGTKSSTQLAAGWGFALFAEIMTLDLSAGASAREPGQDAYMIRVLACEGPDAKMEVYLPQSLVTKGDAALHKMRPTIGTYTLDLTAALKGKVLEPVRLSMSPDGKALIVDQYTRGLPPTRIPVGGGVVDFDKRFGARAKCGAFNAKEE